MKMRIGICEDDSFTLATLEAALKHEGVDVLFAAKTAPEALEKFAKNKPHAMLIDLHLGDGPNGLELAREIRKRNLEIGITFLSSFESPKLLDKMKLGMPAGSQFLKKDSISNVSELISALQRSLRAKNSTGSSGGLVSSLTARQLEVLECIAAGESNQEIAKRLGVTQKSVEALLSRIAKQLQIAGTQSTNQRVQMTKAYIRAIGGVKERN